MKKFDFNLTAWLAIFMSAVALLTVQAGEKEKSKSDPAQQIMESYFATGEMLAKDSFKGIDKEMEKIISASEEILKAEANNSEEKKDYLALVQAIQASARDFDSQDLKSSRESYKSLSQAVAGYVKTYGYSDPAYSFYCPMVNQAWFQSSEKIANPFYGSEMLRCGKMTGMVKEGKYVTKPKETTGGHKH
jgi:hypothetical protein